MESDAIRAARCQPGVYLRMHSPDNSGTCTHRIADPKNKYLATNLTTSLSMLSTPRTFEDGMVYLICNPHLARFDEGKWLLNCWSIT